MDKSKRTETREFWEEAVRLWNESGLSVRDFCTREGLAEYTFYVRRRELLPENTVYLTELKRHAVELQAAPESWMPWNYRQTLDSPTVVPTAAP